MSSIRPFLSCLVLASPLSCYAGNLDNKIRDSDFALADALYDSQGIVDIREKTQGLSLSAFNDQELPISDIQKLKTFWSEPDQCQIIEKRSFFLPPSECPLQKIHQLKDLWEKPEATNVTAPIDLPTARAVAKENLGAIPLNTVERARSTLPTRRVVVKKGKSFLMGRDTAETEALRKHLRLTGKAFEIYDACLDYLKFLKIDTLHLHNIKGKDIKIAVMDNWFDYNVANLRGRLTESTIMNAPPLSSANYVNMFRGQAAMHGNHVTSIITTIAPESKIQYINFQALSKINGTLMPQDYVRGIKSALISKEKPDFINFSLKFPDKNGAEVTTIDQSIIDALVKLAENKIGVIVALGNDETPLEDHPNLKSLVELAHHPRLKGRMLLVAATQYKNDKERRADFSNYPLNIENAERVVAAPGHDIAALGAGNLMAVKSGTSQATPIVTGTAALLKQYLKGILKRDVLPEEVFDLMLASARQETYTGSGVFDLTVGQGVIAPMEAIRFVHQQQSAISSKSLRENKRPL